MAMLLPTAQALDIRRALSDYLATTFAFAEPEAERVLTEFIGDPHTGMFRGPYLRARLPFAPADTAPSYSWGGLPYAPYGHQAAAFTRLATHNLGPSRSRPEPTIVTTGTGSGKTEAFLVPIMDYCTRLIGTPGIKALILYPMNALAGDQARRIAELITTNPALSQVRAGVYTGEQDGDRTAVTPDGLITNRNSLRDNPPDILLTNYKMLDQLLFRSNDQELWHRSAATMRFLVLDEFHTYDGAQGTDVAMLIRRLGLKLKSLTAELGSTADGQPITEADRQRPLGFITSVATSATLGDDNDTTDIRDFAETVFGEPFAPEAIISETRLSVDGWLASVPAPAGGLEPRGMSSLNTDFLPRQSTFTQLSQNDDAPLERARSLAAMLWGSAPREISVDDAAASEDLVNDNIPGGSKAEAHITGLALDEVAVLVARHPLTRNVIDATAAQPSTVAALAASILPNMPQDDAEGIISEIATVLSYLRTKMGRTWPGLETHMWVRELSRIDRLAKAEPQYQWHDDGMNAAETPFAAMYCRSCGRTGWGVKLETTGENIDGDAQAAREASVRRDNRFRVLIHAPHLADPQVAKDHNLNSANSEMRWFHTSPPRLEAAMPREDDEDYLDGRILPVVYLRGKDADKNTKRSVCPNCDRPDSTRFIGSALSTLLSVTISSMFGSPALSPGEKKALVFTDSVQDAAHRAGFVQARSHTITQRTLFRASMPDAMTPLTEVAKLVEQDAGHDPERRYRLLPPADANDDLMRDYWRDPRGAGDAMGYHERALGRLQFDLMLEVGLNAKFGRTLEETGAISVEVDLGGTSTHEIATRAAIAASGHHLIDETHLGSRLAGWVRGVVEHMRRQGGINHTWLERFLKCGADRYFLWGGVSTHVPMPKFPPQRSAPTFPRVQGTSKLSDRLLVDNVCGAQSWYVAWTRKCFGTDAAHAARLLQELFGEFAAQGVVTFETSDAAGTLAALVPSRVLIAPTTPPEEAAMVRAKGGGVGEITSVGSTADGSRPALRARCSSCNSTFPGTQRTMDELDGMPCMDKACRGTLRRESTPSNYYRELYSTGDARRVVAREHTSVIASKTRLRIENEFKKSAVNPDAPNVLVATPTLEMGIDIGDLSTVLLSSLPHSVASYTQRAGRAGRKTGNALVLAFVRGRGANLGYLAKPYELISGPVVPPATYLSAEEILRRQYFAYLCDVGALNDWLPEVKSGDDALRPPSESASFLGTLARKNEQLSDELLTHFLDSFSVGGSSLVSQEVARDLREWATAESTAPSSFRQRLEHAASRYAARQHELQVRIDAIAAQLPALRAAADRPQANDEDKRAEGLAQSALRQLAAERHRASEATYWVSMLEEYGLLPNYTLLGDDVQLDVDISIFDSESNAYSSESASYKRPGASALTEFAPGATFYVDGMQVDISTVDLGSEAGDMKKVVFCPSCGYNEDEIATPPACPRCGDTDIYDVAAAVDVVELTRVGAHIQRSQSLINDSHDDRKQSLFKIQALADIDPANVRNQWFDKNTGFGVKLLSQVALRWINLGAGSAQGQLHSMSGNSHTAGLFRLCRACGHLDADSGKNEPREHTPWCSLRKAAEGDTVTIALSRTLTTQGLLLRLPSMGVESDRFALPSLSAALRLGLTMHFGGAPSHLDLMPTRDPDGPGQNGRTTAALLIHDVVPGGSGYLPDLAQASTLYELLLAALAHLHTCECQRDDVVACHRCLLPHAPRGQADSVSRLTAARLLSKILSIDTTELDQVRSGVAGNDGDADAERVIPMSWDITHAPVEGSPESALELAFRTAFLEALEKRGVRYTSTPGDFGNIETLVAPGDKRTWKLEPQVLVGGSRPDFQLRCSDTNIPDVYIFTDGFRYHATAAHNRVADDIRKRESLRAAGHIVVSVTAADLGEDAEVIAAVRNVVNHMVVSPELGAALMGGPVAFLTEWVLSQPLREVKELAQGTIGQCLGEMQTIETDEPAPSIAEKILAGHVFAPSNEPNCRASQPSRHLSIGARYEPLPPRHYETVIALDDSNDAVASDDFKDSWYQWLGLRNAIAVANADLELAHVVFTTTSLLARDVSEKSGGSAAPAVTSSELETLIPQSLLENYGEPDPEMVQTWTLIAPLNLPEPQFGTEVRSWPVDIAWHAAKVVVLVERDEEICDDLTNAGWHVLHRDDTDFTQSLTSLVE